MSYFDNNMSGLLGGGQPYAQPFDAMSGINNAMQQNAAQPAKRSFFDKLGNALGNDDAQMHFAAAAAYAKGDVATAAQILAHSQAVKQAEAEYEKKRHDDMSDWQAKQDYEAAHKPQHARTIQVDGIVLDADTMQPIWESPYPHIIGGPSGFYEQPRIGLGQGGQGGPMPQAPQGIPVTSAFQNGWKLADDGGAPQPGARPFPY